MPYPRQRFAQHWLKDARVHQAIVQAARLAEAGDPAQTTVLEIGPGTGQLTRRLLQMGVQVIAVEIDRDLCRLLHKQFADQPRFQLIEGDFLQMPLPTAASFVVANIPYNITSPILEKILGSPAHPIHQFERIVLLVQQELAQRLTASVGSKAYGAMSLRMQYLADCQLIQTVPARAFKPPPKVESAIISLAPRPPAPPALDPAWLETLLQQGFAMRRKMLLNTLQSLLPKSQLAPVFAGLSIEATVRAEQLTLAQWIELSDRLLPLRQAFLHSASQPEPPQPTEEIGLAVESG
ncbi:MAG: 16S rRNA (adenine(1518)-N(6)/adenine(1519)-N(6))-dimethyltransferase RsmA [Cyanobacteriota bacterium]|nr:16S rRNA (adenine(1518)-N(6)/adenine(1519)-N(6))-dimethyltransferase RsmA [Cyanobacteriota bacterium]